MSGTSLVLCGGGLTGLALVRALRALPGWRVLVGDSFAENLASYEAHANHRLPLLSDAAAFDEQLLALCRAEGVREIFPATQMELQALLRLRPALQTLGCRVWVSDPPVQRLAADKLLLCQWLAEHQLPVLPSHDDVRLGDLPLLGKPRDGWGGRGLVRLTEAAERDAWLKERGLVWQPLLQAFDEYSIDFAIDDQGQASPMQPRRRLRQLGGFCMLAEPRAMWPALERAMKGLVDALAPLGARGLFNVQVLVSGEQLWMSDFNARVGTSMPLTLAAGLSPVAFLLGGPAQAPQLPVRTVRTMRERALPRLHLDEVRGLVFDLDDCLLDQKRWMLDKLAQTWASQQGPLGLPDWPAWRDELLLILEEGERARWFDRWCERHGAPETTRQALIQAYRAAQPARAPLYHDVAACLAQLRRQGYRLALLSDNPAASQRAKLAACELPQWLDAVVLSDDLGQRKPAASCFEAAAAALGLEPQQLVMVGDHPWRDARGALDAGYRHAFLVRREGGFFNFGHDSLANWLPDGRWTALHEGLWELHWVLKGRAA
ncbi:HAD-IA family hydrolase [Inhella sp.]|uniref:HAD-IA family hydrolase n=1 Tax=Inhella sp. TaxID=1921806 RepID=UPI0035AEE022